MQRNIQHGPVLLDHSFRANILCGILSGKAFGMVPGRPNFSHFVGAYNIEAFTDPDWFLDTMDEMLATLRNTKPAPGHDRVLYPGLPEYEEELNRIDNGIPLHKEVIEWFDGITAELGLPKLARK